MRLATSQDRQLNCDDDIRVVFRIIMIIMIIMIIYLYFVVYISRFNTHFSLRFFDSLLLGNYIGE